MRVLVACEFSGIVRDALRRRGHDAVSCDLLPTESHPECHIQGDIRDVLHRSDGHHGYGWDMMLAFPPCTYLTMSNAWRWDAIAAERAEAVAFVRALADVPGIPMVAVENPAGALTRAWRRPDQYVHPWQFGRCDDGGHWQKRTGLWLRGLPLLRPSVRYKPYDTRPYIAAGYHFQQGVASKTSVSESGARSRDARSLTFSSIAEAMAHQWG